MSIRRNLSPELFALDDPEEIYDRALKVIRQSNGYEGYLQGTSIVPYGTPSEKLLAVRRACQGALIDSGRLNHQEEEF